MLIVGDIQRPNVAKLIPAGLAIQGSVSIAVHGVLSEELRPTNRSKALATCPKKILRSGQAISQLPRQARLSSQLTAVPYASRHSDTDLGVRGYAVIIWIGRHKCHCRLYGVGIRGLNLQSTVSRGAKDYPRSGLSQGFSPVADLVPSSTAAAVRYGSSNKPRPDAMRQSTSAPINYTHSRKFPVHICQEGYPREIREIQRLAAPAERVPSVLCLTPQVGRYLGRYCRYLQ